MSADERWTRHLFYRSERIRTTWKLRIAFVILLVLMAWLTRPWWTVALAESLVCDRSLAPSDAILVENFEPNYLSFERATRLRTAGFSPRVLVPLSVRPGAGVSDVALGITEVMARISRLGAFEVVPLHQTEPISLNAAYDVLAFLQREHVSSVIVVSPLFRSRRSALVYRSTIGRAGITVHCDTVGGTIELETWTASWHGIQDVVEQWLKLQYYRLYVLPFRLR